MEPIQMCVAVEPRGRDRMSHKDRRILAPTLAVRSKLLWRSGQTLRVAFWDGQPALHQRVAQVALEWTQHANINLDFIAGQRGDIRVTFRPGDSSSAIGTEAKEARYRGKPSMNFGWLDPQVSDKELRRVVLHEFGHALGCIHEHQNPQAGIQWNRKAVYAHFGDRMTRPEIDANILAPAPASSTNSSAYDPHSIMIYAIPAGLTKDGYAVEWNHDLSSIDRQFMAERYP